MTIVREIDREKGLTVFQVSGRVSDEAFRKSIEGFYGDGPTPSVLIDLRKAEGEGVQFTHERVTRMTDFVESVRKGRDAGKTALVTDSDVLYGLCRMVESYLQGGSVPVRTFRTLESAMKWLEEGG